MKKGYRFITAVLFIMIFVVKAMVCVNKTCFNNDKEKTEQREAELPADDKAISSEKYVIAGSIPFNYCNIQISERLYFLNHSHTFLPKQYFAVPTPPPWFKS